MATEEQKAEYLAWHERNKATLGGILSRFDENSSTQELARAVLEGYCNKVDTCPHGRSLHGTCALCDEIEAELFPPDPDAVDTTEDSDASDDIRSEGRTDDADGDVPGGPHPAGATRPEPHG